LADLKQSVLTARYINGRALNKNYQQQACVSKFTTRLHNIIQYLYKPIL